MNTLPEIIAILAFISVITIIIFEWLDMTVAGLLGALILVFFHVMTLPEAMGYISKSHGTLALFLGVMINGNEVGKSACRCMIKSIKRLHS